MTLHLAIEDNTPDDWPEGFPTGQELLPCLDCGQPTWYARCDECNYEREEAKYG